MSSGFVSGGTSDAPIERDDAWLTAQKELEANRARKAAIAKQTDGKSLYETLEANKAAKQEAFEEASRLKNQFRALDQDEVEFLDEVLQKTRADEDRIKKETAEGLAAFRQQQEEADKMARGGEAVDEKETAVEEETWVAGGRKRKRTKEKEVLKGVKIRRSSTVEKSAAESPSTVTPVSIPSEKESLKAPVPEHPVEPKQKPAPDTKKPPAKGGLVDYGSDEDDDW